MLSLLDEQPPRREGRERRRDDKWRTVAAMVRTALYIWMLLREVW